MQRITWRSGTATLALIVALVASASPVGAQNGPSGPGQAVPQPSAQCPQTIGCTYAEENLIPVGYRLQSLQVCGANCTTQYWVSLLSNDQQLLEIDPVRGGAIVATNANSVRVVMPAFGPNDPACCPSGFSDTTYTWDDPSGSLVAGQPEVTPSDQFPGFDAVRQELQSEGWQLATV